MKQDTIVEAVRQDLLDRSKRGQLKYGTTLDRKDLDLTEWLQQQYEELLDGALYSRRLMQEFAKQPKPPQQIPAAEIASDIMSLPQIRELSLGWEQRSQLHKVITGVVAKSRM